MLGRSPSFAENNTTSTLAVYASFCPAVSQFVYWMMVGFLTFTYPYVPVLRIGAAILLISIIVPAMAYRAINQTTIIERLKATE